MKVVYGDIWEYPAGYICLTTNGDVRKDGAAVMGRGVALQAKERFPGIEFAVGEEIRRCGNVLMVLDFIDWRSSTREEHNPRLFVIFPVKHHWREPADLGLIHESAMSLAELAEEHPDKTFILGRPGCGNGGLTWDEVRPVLEGVGLPDNVHIIDRRETR